MRAADVIGPNESCCYWDVPGSDLMVCCYRVLMGGPFVYEVIEPSSIMGRNSTIMHLSDGQTKECYGTVMSRRSTHRYRSFPHHLESLCYRTIVTALGEQFFSDLGDNVYRSCGEIRVSLSDADEKGPIKEDVRVEIKNHYFKHYADEPQRTFISGLQIPNADYRTKTVSNMRFIGCKFHPGCDGWTFKDCDFIGCSGNKRFKTESCWIPQETDN